MSLYLYHCYLEKWLFVAVLEIRFGRFYTQEPGNTVILISKQNNVTTKEF